MVQDVVVVPEEASTLKLKGVDSGSALVSSAESSNTGMTSKKRAASDCRQVDEMTTVCANKRNQLLPPTKPKISGEVSLKQAVNAMLSSEGQVDRVEAIHAYVEIS